MSQRSPQGIKIVLTQHSVLSTQYYFQEGSNDGIE
jgi:hypothetical protein